MKRFKLISSSSSPNGEKTCSEGVNQILERKRVTSVRAKLFYAARATRGHRFYGVPTTPRGRDLFLLDLFFG